MGDRLLYYSYTLLAFVSVGLRMGVGGGGADMCVCAVVVVVFFVLVCRKCCLSCATRFFPHAGFDEVEGIEDEWNSCCAVSFEREQQEF